MTLQQMKNPTIGGTLLQIRWAHVKGSCSSKDNYSEASGQAAHLCS